MIKVKLFTKKTRNTCSGDGLEDDINAFIEENNIEFVDIKYSSALYLNNEKSPNYILLSALLIYKVD